MTRRPRQGIRMPVPKPDSPRVFVAPPLMFATALVAGLAFDGRLTRGWSATPAAWWWLGGVLAVFGVILVAISLGRFWRSGTRPEPWVPDQVLVVQGIYRWTRNPMYLGMTAISLGLALLIQSATAVMLLVPVWLAMNFIVIAREEAYLDRRFGEAYFLYRRSTRRSL